MAIEVGQPQSSGIGGIPTRYVIIGAGVLGVGALLLMQRKAPAAVDPNSGDVQPTGSVSAQLSSVQQLQLQQFGELTKLFAHQEDTVGTQIGGLSAHLDSQAGALSSQLAGSYQTLSTGQQMLSGQMAKTWDAGQWLRNLFALSQSQAGNAAYVPVSESETATTVARTAA